MRLRDLPPAVVARFRRGCVIPALPLALDRRRRFAERHQRAVLRYYLEAGVGGVAVGVHSTQFEIRDPQVGLFEPVLRFAADVLDRDGTGRPVLKVAGICGRTPQARREAEFARGCGYHAALLSLAAMARADVPALLRHCRAVAAVMPLLGFYLQPAVGGRVLPYAFWRGFFELDNVLGVKIAPFNRYQTFDVVRALVDAGRTRDVTLYTGNDDNIVLDLLTEYRVAGPRGVTRVRIAGGLLGHWAVWTRKAVELLATLQRARTAGRAVPAALLTRAAEVTDSNAAFFDVANGFRGCLPGLHEVLRRQGLFAGTWCLNPRECLSPGQREEIDRVCRAYPHLNDDAFVRANLDRWLRP